MSSKLGLRPTLAAFGAAGLVGEALLTGCSSANGTTQSRYPGDVHPAKSMQTCQADKLKAWQRTPSNFFANNIATLLDVPTDSVKQAGRSGDVVCPDAIPVERVFSARDAVIVAVPNEGDPCLVVGRGDEDDPNYKAAKQITKVLVVCANPIPTSGASNAEAGQ